MHLMSGCTSCFLLVPQLAGKMATYDDNNWIGILRGLDLTPDERAAAKLLLFEKGAAYRQMMLGDDGDSNKKVILLALGESLLYMGCVAMHSGKRLLGYFCSMSTWPLESS